MPDGMTRFPATRWSLVSDAAHEDPQGLRSLLEELVNLYRAPLHAYICRFLQREVGCVEEADDLLQGFIADKILEQNLLGRADPVRGRFRSFLLCVLHNYICTRLKREQRFTTLGDSDSAVPDTSSQRQFELDWARQVVPNALRRMEHQCREQGRSDVWELFEQRYVTPILSNTKPPDYRSLSDSLPTADCSNLYNLLVTGKRRFIKAVREEIGSHEPLEVVDDEVKELIRILSRGK